MTRTYDAAQTRRRLLDAARALFGEHGFEATTTRQIAERADVDAALIARYFGSKANLYLAAEATESDGRPQPTVEGIAAWALAASRDRPIGIVLQSLTRRDVPPEVRAASLARVEERLLAPLTATLREAGVADPRLQAELAVYSIVGLVIGRAQPGSALDLVDEDELVALVGAAFSSIASVASVALVASQREPV